MIFETDSPDERRDAAEAERHMRLYAERGKARDVGESQKHTAPAEAERELLEAAEAMLAVAEPYVPHRLSHARLNLREAVRRYRETR